MRRLAGIVFLVVLCALPRLAAGQARASSYVPMDSWVYPLIDRMIARGELEADGVGMRPWTRAQFASLLERCEKCESQEIRELRREFGDDSNGSGVARLEEMYVRSELIAGAPLTNGFDYGQTIVNDYGRANRQGQNLIAGVQARAGSRWVMSGLRLEYQQAGTDSSQFEVIRGIDGAAAASQRDIRATHRVRLIEGYIGTRVGNLQMSVGNQGVHWGRGYSGAMLMGENAEPLTMLRFRNAESFRMPWIFSRMGKWRGEFFVGKLNGHVEPFSPWLQGQKITIAVTPTLEFGFSRTIVFAGGGRGLARSFGRSFFSVGSNLSMTPGGPTDVGDRRGGFDVQYRLPKLRNQVTLYVDSFTDDDPSPLSAPHRAAFLGGVYLPKLPRLAKMDLRVESAYTDAPGVRGDGRFFYVNGGYVQSYSNHGQLLGHWVGRAGKAYQAWGTYWFSPTTKAQVSVRTLQMSANYLRGGGRQWDFAGSYETRLRKNVDLAMRVQGEQWRIPVLDTRTRNNVSISFQATYHPHWFTSAN